MLIRVRQGSSSQTLTLADDATFAQVKQQVRDAFGLAASEFDLFAGFPAKALAGSPDEPASKAGLKGGQQVEIRLTGGGASAGTGTGTGAGAGGGAAAGAGTPSTASASASVPASVASVASSSSSSSAASSAMAPADPRWSCPACTLLNAPSAGVCEVCGTKKPESASKMTRIVVPADNSCLFTSVGLCTDEAGRSRTRAAEMRRRVADHIRTHPSTFNEAFLGKTPAAYLAAVEQPAFWGGGIECLAFSELLGVEVVTVDIRTGLALRFGEDKGFAKRMFLLYDGIHYDPLAMATGAGERKEDIKQTVFDVSDAVAMEAALRIGKELKDARAFVDTANFALICLNCNTGLKGEKEAQEHAAKTKHTNFAEKR